MAAANAEGRLTRRPSHTPGMRSITLGAAVFVSSAAILVLEILAGRILAPFVGLTLRSFTGIIGTVLAAIAVGAWAGGRLADRVDPSRLLGPVLVAGGLLAATTPTIVTTLGPTLSGEAPLRIVTLAFVGFFAPAVVLAAVTPIAAKLALRSLAETGAVVGGLSALGTAGALFGTFVTGFVLIAAMPSRPITWVVAAVLVVFGIGLSTSASRLVRLGAVPLLAAAIVLGTAVPSPCQIETAYFCASVRVDAARPTGRELILDTLRHSYVDVADPTYLGSRYARVITGVVEATMPEGELDVLYIGGGGFTLPRFLAATRGGSATVLELDQTVVDIAEAELGLEPGPWLTVVVGDARVTLAKAAPSGFDVVVGDAFGGPAVPFHLTTVEFLESIATRLRPGGLYVLNVIDHPPTRFVRAEAATLARVFPYVGIVAPQGLLDGLQGGNYVLVGSKDPLDPAALAAVMSDGEVAITGDDAREFAAGAIVLRDEHAPADQLLGRP